MSAIVEKAPCLWLTIQCADRERALAQWWNPALQAANLSETNITMAVITLHINGTYSPQVTTLLRVLPQRPWPTAEASRSGLVYETACSGCYGRTV